MISFIALIIFLSLLMLILVGLTRLQPCDTYSDSEFVKPFLEANESIAKQSKYNGQLIDNSDGFYSYDEHIITTYDKGVFDVKDYI